MAGSNEEAAELSRRVQAKLVATGTVRDLTAELSDGNRAGIGDLIRARLNTLIEAGGRNLTNRDTLRIAGWAGPDARVQRRTLEGEWTETFVVPRHYLENNAELDYAGNTHVAEGRTVDTGHLLVSESLDRASFYVGMTRGRESNTAHIVTGDTAPAGGKPFEQANPESVVKSVLARDEPDLSAAGMIRESQEWAGGTGHVLNLWSHAVRAKFSLDVAEVLKARLTTAEFNRFSRDGSTRVLLEALRERQIRGQDAMQLVEQISAEPLDGARSIAGVLHGRLMAIAQPDADEATWAARTPATAPQLAHELAEGIDARIAELGERSVAEPQPWLASQLGMLAPDAYAALRADGSYAPR